MLNLAQTTELLNQAHALSPEQFNLISRLHKENLVRARKIKTINCTDNLFNAKVRGDIRYNPARADKYKALGEKPIVAKAINPNTGDYVDFTRQQLSALRQALGKGRVQAIKIARAC